jgi:hypothetical protein
MEKQTAVEWAMSQIIRGHFIGFAEEFQNIYDKAKAMEKEQIEEAFSIGEMNNDSHHYTGRKIHKYQADYYNKTYAK